MKKYVISTSNLHRDNPFWKLAIIALILDRLHTSEWQWIVFIIIASYSMLKYFWFAIDETPLEILKQDTDKETEETEKEEI